MKRPVLLLLSLCLGCAADVAPAQLTAQFTGQGLEVSLHRTDGACPMLGTARATVDGVPMTTLSPGQLGGGYFGIPGCGEPHFLLTSFTPSDPTRFQIEGTGVTIEATFGHLFAPRSATLVDPASGPFHSGQTLTLEWSPATDDIQSHSALGVRLEDVWPDGTDSYLLATTDPSFQAAIGQPVIEVTGNRIRAPLPQGTDPVLPSGHHLALDVEFSAQVQSCQGVAHCATVQDARVDIPDTTAP